jgi:hypothetical protein
MVEIYPLPCNSNNTSSLYEIEIVTSNIIDHTESHEMITQSLCPSEHDDMTITVNVVKIIIGFIIIIIIGVLVFYYQE